MKITKFFTIVIPAIAAIVTAIGTGYQVFKPKEVLVISDKNL